MGNEAVMTTLVVWASPVLAMLIGWFIVNHVTEVKDKIKDVDTTIKVISKELTETQKTIVKIQSDVEYLKTDVKVKPEDFEKNVIRIFENSAVKVIKNARKRFE